MPEFHTDYQQYIYRRIWRTVAFVYTTCDKLPLVFDKLKEERISPQWRAHYAGKDVATQKQIHSDVTHYRLNFRKFVGHRVEADLEDLTYLEISDIQQKRVPKIAQAGY